ncbi:MAG: 3-oxoacyl-[acyl-carrier-protein] synthase II [Verrucomicrobiales bacterium]|jgi:3-oxoacyl-[acyl-carrier-protein] synthase II
MSEEVHITGLGCLSPLAFNQIDFWKNLCAGECGIREISNFDSTHFLNRSAGEIVLSPELEKFGEAKQISSRLTLFAAWAIEEALADGGYDLESLRTKKVGLVLGVSLGMSLSALADGGDVPEIHSDFGSLSADLEALFPISGDNFVITTACAAGTNAIGVAQEMVEFEDYDLVICGGVDTLDAMKYFGHSALSTLTPDRVAPFCDHRSGTLFGEGAGILLLSKSRSQAERSDYGRCTGAGYSCDASHVTGPDETGDGALRAMAEALAAAGLEPDQIDYVNLHGSGTMANDEMEAAALKTLFGEEPRFLSSSIKPAIGHLMGAAGAVEAIATVQSLKLNVAPPTLHRNGEGKFRGISVVNEATPLEGMKHVLSNSFGFGGNNGTVVFSK